MPSRNSSAAADVGYICVYTTAYSVKDYQGHFTGGGVIVVVLHEDDKVKYVVNLPDGDYTYEWEKSANPFCFYTGKCMAVLHKQPEGTKYAITEIVGPDAGDDHYTTVDIGKQFNTVCQGNNGVFVTTDSGIFHIQYGGDAVHAAHTIKWKFHAPGEDA